MGYNYKKIEYCVEGAYGSTEKRWLYIKSSRTTDCVTVYDDNKEVLFTFTEWDDFNMGDALKTAFTNWNDEKMKDLTIEEIKELQK